MIRYSAIAALICCYMLGFQACTQKATPSLDTQCEEEVEVLAMADTTADMKPISDMSKHFSNSYFSIDFPNTYQIYQEDNQVTSSTSVSIQIMEVQRNDYDFLANINVIVSSTKHSEPVSTLAAMTIEQMKTAVTNYRLLKQTDNIALSKAKGCLVESSWMISGYSLSQQQYIVKKADNTTYVITLTWDSTRPKQKKVLHDILNTLNIK